MKWMAVGASGVLLGAGLTIGVHRATSLGSPPVFVRDGCTPAEPGVAAVVRELPAALAVPGEFGPVMSATATRNAIVLDVGNATMTRPEWLVGLDPRTLRPRWRWKFPADPGPVTESGADEPWITAIGDLAFAITGVGGPQSRPRLHALDLRTGKPRWTREFPAGTWPVAVHIDLCRVVVNDKSSDLGPNGTRGLWGFGTGTGRTLWQNGPAPELLCTDPARPWFYAGSGKHLLRYGMGDGQVTAASTPVDPCDLFRVSETRRIDIRTGKWYAVDWSRPAVTESRIPPIQVPEDGSAGFHLIGDTLVISANFRATAVDSRSGAIRWRSESFLAARGGLYFGEHSPFTERRRTVVLSAADPRTGRVLWRSARFPGNDLIPQADPRTGAVLLQVPPARLYALDGADGHTLWTVDGVSRGVAGQWLLMQTGSRLRGYRMS